MNTKTLAQWLAGNVNLISRHEHAGDCYRDIQNIINDIEHAINRPIPDQFCGTCQTPYEGQPCDLALYAPREATEVTCPRCKTLHNIQQLFDQTLANTDGNSFTISELHRMILPAVREYVAPNKLQHWAASGRLVPTGYGMDGEPRFLLSDVRRLRDNDGRCKDHSRFTADERSERGRQAAAARWNKAS